MHEHVYIYIYICKLISHVNKYYTIYVAHLLTIETEVVSHKIVGQAPGLAFIPIPEVTGTTWAGVDLATSVSW